MEHLLTYLPLLARGWLVTVALAVVSLLLATLLGALGAAGRASRAPLARGAVLVYSTIIRGVPDLVLVLLIYFGGQRFLNTILGALGAPTVDLSPFVAGVIAIGFIYGAYLTETFRGAFLAVPRAQIEAASALGLRRWPLFRHVLLPQIIRAALPGYGNTWQVLVKSTAVVSVIGLRDLVGFASDAGKTTREPFIFFSAVLAGYLLITWGSTRILAILERRAERGYAHAR
ncbi:ABC transporter permease [Amaricoccus solimangrovi]|uniref:ABC transporter permease subunit n=1 Tax=Amaricoccus solimangrovi TaxID=2589815 RepID=A0A501WY92_9RHOB|nr:ABC transporter permease subunit [Amaricoccus solimangrovi]TPE53530.1 ABC transporter permease subunit [Amaricoccus solimangrovi]